MNQAIRLAVRQPAQQCGVDHGEYRRVRADAQRECDDGNQCEAGILQQPSRAITQVLPECAHKTLLNQECSARELIGWRKSLLEHKKHKEEHKEHKYSFGSDLSLSICIAPLIIFLSSARSATRSSRRPCRIVRPRSFVGARRRLG